MIITSFLARRFGIRVFPRFPIFWLALVVVVTPELEDDEEDELRTVFDLTLRAALLLSR